MNSNSEELIARRQLSRDQDGNQLSRQEICAAFLVVLSRSIKMSALYRLNHPMVVESLAKAVSLLGMIFASQQEDSVTLAFEHDSWLFNDTPVPSGNNESQILSSYFKNHGVRGLAFSGVVETLELGALCEFFSTTQKNPPEGFFKKFLLERGIQTIRPVEVRWVKEGRNSGFQGAQPARPTPAAREPEPEIDIAADFPEPVVLAQDWTEPEFIAEARPPQVSSRQSQASPLPAARPAARPAPRPQAAAPEVKAAQDLPEVISPFLDWDTAADPGEELPAQPARRQAAEFPAPAAQPAAQPAPRAPAAQGQAQTPGPFTRAPAAQAQAPAVPKAAPPSKAAPSSPGAAPLRTEKVSSGAAPAPAPGVNSVPPRSTVPAPSPAPALQGTGAGAAGGPGTGPLSGGVDFGALLAKLSAPVGKDPDARVNAYKDALGLIRDAMEKQVTDAKNTLAQVAEATKTLMAEKEQILNARTRTEEVLNTVADGKVIIDKEGRILMMNQAAEEISGKKLSEVVGMHISDQVNSGEHVLTMSGDMDLSKGHKLSGQVNVTGDKSVERAMRRSVALLEDDEGRVVGTYSTLPDVAKYKETQRLQEEFLSRVTHDLQSPLSSISSALEMLTESAGTRLDPTENKFLDISIRNSHRLVQMIRGILDFSKLQSGKMEVSIKPSPLGAILKEAGEGLMPWAKTKGISLLVKSPAPDLMVLADHPRMVQVLTNLMSNALKSTPSGGTVVVAASPSPDDAQSVIVGVRDTGHGMSKEDLAKIFQKFVQIKSAEPREGVGLGLAIVSEFVKLHSGKIWAASEPGKGATFYFTLPLGACPT